MKIFEIPAFDVKRDVLPRIQDTSNLLREFDEETNALSISLALHLFFQDDFPSMTRLPKASDFEMTFILSKFAAPGRQFGEGKCYQQIKRNLA